MQSRRQRFTFVELMAVLAVIVIVAALAMLWPRKARQSGHRPNCASHLKQIGLASLMYSGDNNGYFMNAPISPIPGGANFGVLDGTEIQGTVGNWATVATLGYMATQGKVWTCPKAAIPLTDERSSNYLYSGSGLRDDNARATEISIGRDHATNHPDFSGSSGAFTPAWINAIYMDGHVEGAKAHSSL